MIPKSDDVKYRHELAFDTLRDAVNNVLEGVPEVRSVAVIVDWNIGRVELPFGLMIGRQGSVRTADELFPLMEQTAKMSGFQSKLMAEILVRIDMEAKRITDEYNKTQTRASEIEHNLKFLEEKIAATKAKIEERNLNDEAK